MTEPLNAPLPDVQPGPDGRPRCRWCLATATYSDYHDHEWGFPVADDRRLFEKLSLESFQAGLSWRTILEKRAQFRRAFADFDIQKVAAFTAKDVERLMQDPGIVRHRGKIEAVIHNAGCASKLIAEAGSLAAFLWTFAPPATRPLPVPLPSVTPEAVVLARALKARGWKFFGPTTAYAFMQAMGMVNDHAAGCAWRALADGARASFTPPSGK